MEEKSKEELIDIGKLPDVKILAGSHNKITIEKLYGPACVPDLTIIWDGNDWNVRTKNKELRELLRGDKMKKQTTDELPEGSYVNSWDLKDAKDIHCSHRTKVYEEHEVATLIKRGKLLAFADVEEIIDEDVDIKEYIRVRFKNKIARLKGEER